MENVQAWVLPAGPEDRSGGSVRGELTLTRIPVASPGEHEVLVESLVGCWEANMEHALARSPVDIVRQRGEEQIVIGTCGVVRVLSTGSAVRGLREGQECLWIPFGQVDRNGYAETICAYDAPGSPGLLAERMVVPADRLVPLPADGRYPLERWAPFARYFTAWDNWRVTSRCWRSQVDDAWDEQPLVLGWGGGVVFAELELARREGFRTAMVSGRESRLKEIAASGATAVDRREFPDLDYLRAKESTDPDAMDRYRASEARFLEIVGELSGGHGASVFLDNLGGGLHRATMKSLAREGVVSTVGWKTGMRLWNLRATECISRHIHVHTHAWRLQDAPRIRDVMQETGWLPDIADDPVTPFARVPELADVYRRDDLDTYFPLFSGAGRG
ncbi:zinc-binding alcohol dehydrogenase family protein [Streptomyces poriticola]|uniref:zinc-binding alcohol dehydrogenase family protein n=1 Tax=Streptomyces poriticola TaxID=3120506 RepID=UPI002FCE5A11